ncbi:MAG: hypothetical protein KAW12_24570 [Candidatus Aminicenantes bacterium]|nr:hypothetical protein [Candidatus Aminicenantes bacterium]
MRTRKFQFRLPDDLRNKVLRDSVMMGFPSISSYLCKLIEIGLPQIESKNINVQDVIQEQRILLDSLSEKVNDLQKRDYITYKIAAHILARSFFTKPGVLPENIIAEANSLIESEVKNMEKKFRGK